MAQTSFEETMAQIADQHRSMLERHARWMDAVTSTSVRALVAENRRLQAKVGRSGGAAKREPPPIPALPSRRALEDASPAPSPHGGGMEPPMRLEVAPPPGTLPGMLCESPRDGCGPEPPKCHGRCKAKRAAPEASYPSGMSTVASSTPWKSMTMAPTASAMRRQSLEADGELKPEHRDWRRLCRLFGLRPKRDDEVGFDRFRDVMTARVSSRGRGGGWAIKALVAIDAARGVMARSRPQFRTKWLSDEGFALAGLVHLMGPEAGVLLQHVAPEALEDVLDIATGLKMLSADEVIDEAAALHVTRPEASRSWVERLDIIVNSCVVGIVLLNVFAMGISIDNDPDNLGWFMFEALCVAVFLFEAMFKIYAYGLRRYACGPTSYWNWMDATITVLSTMELSISIWALIGGSNDATTESKISSLARPAVLMRTLRVVRVVRLAKLLHSPLLRDLANMLVGFVIGVPALIWVLAVFGFVLYLLALVFRLMLGPAPGQDLMYRQGCGFGDDLTGFRDEVCKLHYIYGEEFFGTVSSSMFTVFRFMLGDYSTRGGKSMIVAMSQGYGVTFDVVFVTFMIVVIFGLFNIITAIFVDSTTTGLKHNDIKRKYAQQYEREFVRSKLRNLVDRVMDLLKSRPSECGDLQVHNDLASCGFGEEIFVDILRDSVVQELLMDLDISVYNPAGMFDTFDANRDGKVTLFEFVQVVMKLRGEPHKTDIIGCAVSIQNLQDKFDQLCWMVKEVIVERGQDSRASTPDQDAGTVSSMTTGCTL